LILTLQLDIWLELQCILELFAGIPSLIWKESGEYIPLQTLIKLEVIKCGVDRE
jgi:hypothetical protein